MPAGDGQRLEGLTSGVFGINTEPDHNVLGASS